MVFLSNTTFVFVLYQTIPHLYVHLHSGNTLVIAIVAATKALHTVGSVLIVNLAISDLLVGVGVMPLVALSIMNRGWADSTVRPLPAES